MPSPRDVPRRPAWRTQPLSTFGRVVIPSAVTKQDLEIIEHRKTKHSHAETDHNNDQHDC